MGLILMLASLDPIPKPDIDCDCDRDRAFEDLDMSSAITPEEQGLIHTVLGDRVLAGNLGGLGDGLVPLEEMSVKHPQRRIEKLPPSIRLLPK